MQLQRDVGMALAPALHARQQPALQERRHHRQPQPLRNAGRRGGSGQHADIQLCQRRLDAAQQRLARFVEHDAAAAPLKQDKTELLLKHADLLADGAVGQVHFDRGSAQILQAGGGAEDREGM